MVRRPLFWGWLKVVVFLLALMPFSILLYDAFNDRLGANPIQTLHFRCGDWALRFLLLTLALTPMRLLFGWTFQQRFRRMIGLFAFFYASLHLTVYVVLDQSLSWQQIVEEVPQSPYIIVGLITWLLLFSLAITSTRGMARRLGRNWQRLHRLVYLAAVLAVIHFFWLTKEDLSEPMIYAAVLLFLLSIRLFCWRKKIKLR